MQRNPRVLMQVLPQPRDVLRAKQGKSHSKSPRESKSPPRMSLENNDLDYVGPAAAALRTRHHLKNQIRLNKIRTSQAMQQVRDKSEEFYGHSTNSTSVSKFRLPNFSTGLDETGQTRILFESTQRSVESFPKKIFAFHMSMPETLPHFPEKT